MLKTPVTYSTKYKVMLSIKHAVSTKCIYKLVIGILVFNLVACSSHAIKPITVDESAILSPTNNFYQWVNNDWLINTPIPADKIGINNFLVIQKNVNDDISKILSSLKNKHVVPQGEQKLVLIYDAYLDVAKRNELGILPIATELAMIEHAKNHDDIAVLFSKMQKLGVQTPYAYQVGQDFKNSDRNVIFVSQAGLGLDRTNYLNDDVRSKKTRQSYEYFLQQLFKLADIKHADEQAKSVLTLEKSLAKIQWSLTENRDTQKIYNIFDYAKLKNLAYYLDVDAQMLELGMPINHPFVVMQPSYIEDFNQFFIEQDVQVWKSYLNAQLLLAYDKALDERFYRASVAYDVKLSLYDKSPTMEEQAISYLNTNLGMLVGRMYIENAFDASVKLKLNEIIRSIQDEYRVAITESKRLSDKTKAKALDKLDKMAFRIGYPDEWQDYSSLNILPNQLAVNQKKIAAYEVEHNIAKLTRPMDSNDWGHPPQEINAYYDLNANTFVLLAGILYAPFYDKNANDAEHYGGIGFVIAHEISHSFDDQGSEFDGDGNLVNWWQPEDKAEFNKIKNALITQANQYEILPGVFLKGELEIGEILGDKGGAEIAFRAYQKIIKAKNLNQEQGNKDFFKQLAVTWRDHLRPEVQLKILDSDPHPASEFRANGMVKHFDEFHEVYKTKLGDAMYLPKEQRINLW